MRRNLTLLILRPVGFAGRVLPIVAGSACLLFSVLASPGTAHAQMCSQPTQCPGIIALVLYGNRDQECMNTCSGQYSQCLNGIGGGYVGPVDCCLTQFQECLCGCPPADEPIPGPGPVPEACPHCGDPVDTGTGIFLYDATDLVLHDVIPIRLARSYRELDTASRAFGIGMALNYDLLMRLDPSGQYAYADLELPNAARVHYARTTSGNSFFGAVFQNSSSPTIYFGSTLTWNGSGWTLALKNGTQMLFNAASMLTSISDRNSNSIWIERDSLSRATEILSPNGRWIDFTYDSSNRVTQAEDNAGRIVSYAYDAAGRLKQVSDPNGGLTLYSYDSAGRMFSFTTPNGDVHANNLYDSNNRVTRQTQPDGGVYQFAYTLDSNSNVTATAVTDPRGTVKSVSLSTSGYVVADTRAAGRPEQQQDTYSRDPATNLITSVVDTLNRTTAYTYDSLANITSVTRLAGSSNPATTSYSYGVFSQLASVTDPVGHTWTLTLDGNGNVTGVTDPLGDTTAVAYNGAGQIASITDAENDTSRFGYTDGILSSTTDPAGNTSYFFSDDAGRLLQSMDPLGNATSYAYDGLDDLTQIVDALGGVTSVTYDGDRNLTGVTDANGGGPVTATIRWSAASPAPIRSVPPRPTLMTETAT
jgi:YD repeat-containing protein